MPHANRRVLVRARPLAPPAEFARRFMRGALIGALVITLGLGIGAAGYHWLEGLSWLDATLNAAMLLGGEGPVATLHTAAGKVFATAYALFSGVVFITAVSVLLSPVLHRWLHRWHLDVAEGDDDAGSRAD
ncbi:MAG: hypothetical protein U0132_00620 [Gemmatimonadaceae bacterium]